MEEDFEYFEKDERNMRSKRENPKKRDNVKDSYERALKMEKRAEQSKKDKGEEMEEEEDQWD